MKPELEEHYPLRKAAAILGVHLITLRRWEREGKIRYVRTPSGQRRFPRSEVLRLLGKNVPSGSRTVVYFPNRRAATNLNARPETPPQKTPAQRQP